MPRTARITLPNHPHHVVQRGHNRQPVFYSRSDRLAYLSNLVELKHELSCQVHAFCLMTNHVHLVVDPGFESESLGRFIQRLAIRHTMRLNKKHGRSGTLWEGRYRSSPVRSDRYLLACCRYVELNPVRAKLVKTPFEYAWSSCRAKIGLEQLDWLDLDHSYRSLSKDEVQRQSRYLHLLLSGISEDESKVIRRAIRRNDLIEDLSSVPIVSEACERSCYSYNSAQGLSLM